MEKALDTPSATYRAAALGLLALSKFPFSRVTTSGIKNIADSGPQLLAYTHHNDLDVPAIGLTVFRHNRRMVHFWAKEELLDEDKITGKLLRSMQAVPVRRGGPTNSQVREAEEVVKNGGILGLAVEGGRVDGDKVADIQIGAGFIAARQHVEVVPVAVAGSNRRSLGKYRHFVPRPLHVHYSEAIPVEGAGKNAREHINHRLGIEMSKALAAAYHYYEHVHGEEAASQLDRGLTKLF